MESQYRRESCEVGQDLVVGCTVRVTGLQGAPQHNGCHGQLTVFDAENGRWFVRLEADGRELGIRPENLVAVPASTNVGELCKETLRTMDALGMRKDELHHTQRLRMRAVEACADEGRVSWSEYGDCLTPRCVRSPLCNSNGTTAGREFFADLGWGQGVREFILSGLCGSCQRFVFAKLRREAGPLEPLRTVELAYARCPWQMQGFTLRRMIVTSELTESPSPLQLFVALSHVQGLDGENLRFQNADIRRCAMRLRQDGSPDAVLALAVVSILCLPKNEECIYSVFGAAGNVTLETIIADITDSFFKNLQQDQYPPEQKETIWGVQMGGPTYTGTIGQAVFAAWQALWKIAGGSMFGPCSPSFRRAVILALANGKLPHFFRAQVKAAHRSPGIRHFRYDTIQILLQSDFEGIPWDSMIHLRWSQLAQDPYGVREGVARKEPTVRQPSPAA